MKHRIAVLSNINMDFVVRLLKKEYGELIYRGEGYGNELGILLDEASSYHGFKPQITFLIMDLMEVLSHDLDMANSKIETWFSMLEASLKSDRLYYISDAYLWGMELAACADTGVRNHFEQIWNDRLQELIAKNSNVRVFPYRRIIEKIGQQNAFSMKMWYMGKILHSTEAQKELAASMVHIEEVCSRTAKKVLLLDLDNTLWGGLAGEADHTPIVLSEDHSGLAYKNLQRIIAQMQKQGVVLGIISKNNEEDAMDIIRNHPHMVLRPDFFTVSKINWEPKTQNIQEIAAELNLGLDSFVFWDDNPVERESVKVLLPEVSVPDFPQKPEELAEAMTEIYQRYFEKAYVTTEDLQKTKQYAENAKRGSLQKSAGDFRSYLKQLKIVIKRHSPEVHLERLVQLTNKTNQFNLTTHRFELADMQRYLADGKHIVYLYGVEDCFGDNGIVAAVIIDLTNAVPYVDTFVMSCRVMGRNIENAIMEHIEQDLVLRGYEVLHASYIPTAKNKPVADLFDRLGYQPVNLLEDGTKNYKITLANAPKREYYAEVLNG